MSVSVVVFDHPGLTYKDSECSVARKGCGRPWTQSADSKCKDEGLRSDSGKYFPPLLSILVQGLYLRQDLKGSFRMRSSVDFW